MPAGQHGSALVLYQVSVAIFREQSLAGESAFTIPLYAICPSIVGIVVETVQVVVIRRLKYWNSINETLFVC